MPRKILITTESHEVYVVQSVGDASLRFHCAVCGQIVEFVTIDQAVSSSQLSTRFLLGESSDGHLHTVEAASGHLLVCKDSLNAFTRSLTNKE